METAWRSAGDIRNLFGECPQSMPESQYLNKGNRGNTNRDRETETHRIEILPQDPLPLHLGFLFSRGLLSNPFLSLFPFRYGHSASRKGFLTVLEDALMPGW